MKMNNKMPDTTDITQILKKIMAMSETGFCKYSFASNEHFCCDNMFAWFSEREQKILQKKGLFALLPLERTRAINQEIMQAFAQNKEKIEFAEHIELDEKGICIFKINLDLSYGADDEPSNILIIVHDITDQEKARILLQDQKNIANQHAKFRAKQIAHMSHEIRTPMGAIMGMVDVLLSESHSEKTIEKLTIIKQSAEIMMQTLTETLDHCKIMAHGIKLKPTDVSPQKLLTSICLLWQDQASKNNTNIVFKCSEDLPSSIILDEIRIKQCLNNVLSNAVKFTKNGQINIIMKVIDKPGKKPLLAVIVQDTGIGMTEQQQEKIFQPFEQADDDIEHKFGGTGLGMSIIQEIIKTMDGQIIVKSKENMGTIIGLILPLKTASKDVMNAANQNTENVRNIQSVKTPNSPRLRPENILIVDDINTNRVVLQYLLCDIYPNLHYAGNGQEAIDILNESAIDIVLMDIHMPVMNGIEVTKIIRASGAPYKDIPIVAVTADEEYHRRVSCKAVGFDDVIAKPINKARLYSTIEKAVSKARLRHRNENPLIAS